VPVVVLRDLFAVVLRRLEDRVERVFFLLRLSIFRGRYNSKKGFLMPSISLPTHVGHAIACVHAVNIVIAIIRYFKAFFFMLPPPTTEFFRIPTTRIAVARFKLQ